MLVDRNDNIAAAVKRAFNLVKKGVSYGLFLLENMTFSTCHKKKANISFNNRYSVPFSQRSYFDKRTFIISTLGKFNEPIFKEAVEDVEMYFKNSLPLVICWTFSNKINFSVCIAGEIFDEKEIFDLTDKIFTKEYLTS